MKLALALANTIVATSQWWLVEQSVWWEIHWEIRRPALLVPVAWFTTALAAFCWFRWIRSAER